MWSRAERRSSPPSRRRRDAAGWTLRVLLLASLGAAPLALGAVHEPVFIPLLALWSAAGLLAWARGRGQAGPSGPASLPGARLLLAAHALVLLQLVPLPPSLLRLLSPGSFAHYESHSLLPAIGWRPISVNPADSARGLAFLAAMSLLYAAVYREFEDERWQRRLGHLVVLVGALLTVVALFQAASLAPTRIYGWWRPRWDWGVFGPYVSKNHFAGYMVMAIPLGLGLAAESLQTLRHEWSRRRVGWLALGGSAGNAAIRRTALAMVLVVGLLASRSRGGLLGFAVSAVALSAAFKRRWPMAMVVLLVSALGLLWVDMSGTWSAFESRGLRSSRLDLWRDALPMVRHFPLFGSGLDTFGTAFLSFQTVARYEWYGEVHNEYLQVLLDTGLLGVGLFLALLGLLLRRAFHAAGRSPLDAARLAAVLGLCAQNLVDFNWQIPANAATFVALLAVAVRRDDPARESWKGISLTPRKGAPRIALPHEPSGPDDKARVGRREKR